MASSAIEIAIANSERIFVLLVPGFRFPRALRAGRQVTVLQGTANKQRPHENYCAASEAADTDMVKGASNKRASREALTSPLFMRHTFHYFTGRRTYPLISLRIDSGSFRPGATSLTLP